MVKNWFSQIFPASGGSPPQSLFLRYDLEKRPRWVYLKFDHSDPFSRKTQKVCQVCNINWKRLKFPSRVEALIATTSVVPFIVDLLTFKVYSRSNSFFQRKFSRMLNGQFHMPSTMGSNRGERCLLAKVLHEWIETLNHFWSWFDYKNFLRIVFLVWLPLVLVITVFLR